MVCVTGHSTSRAPTSWVNSKRKRARARLFQRAAHPEAELRRIEHRLAAIDVVEQRAVARLALRRRWPMACDGQPLEGVEALARRAGVVGHLLQLHAVVDGEGQELLGLLAPRRRPVHVVDRLVLAQRPVRAAVLRGNTAAPPRSGFPASRAGATPRRRRRHWPRWRSSHGPRPCSQPRRKPDMKRRPRPAHCRPRSGSPCRRCPCRAHRGMASG